MPLFPKEKLESRVLIALIIFHFLIISIQVPSGTEPSYFERAVFFVLSPLQQTIVSTFRFLSNVWTGYVYHVNVQRQNQALRKENFDLRQENAWLQRTLSFLLTRQDLESRLTDARRSVLAASIIDLDPRNPYKSISINRGKLDGLEKDMVVLDRHGFLVGRIIEPISLNMASVQLITDDASGVGVAVEGNRAVGIVSGDAQGRCRLKYILDTAENIAVGNEVLTTGYDGIYPGGLKVGRIVALKSNPTLFKDVVVEPHFRFRDLKQVAVLLTEKRR